MTNLSKTILKKIKDAHIKPRPKWQFIIMHMLLWAIVLIAIILGSLAMSIIFRILGGTDWEVVRGAGRGPIPSFILILPYIWFVFLILILFISNKLFTKTKQGYKYQPGLIALISIIISVIFGAILYVAGIGHIIQKNLIKVGPYASWQQMQHQMVFGPEKGVLVGKILKIESKKQLMIIDFRGAEWKVDISQAKYKNNIQIKINMITGMLGKKTGENTFWAATIVPWKREFIPKPAPNTNIKPPPPLPSL